MIGLVLMLIVYAGVNVSPLFNNYMNECFNNQENVSVYISETNITLDFFNKYSNVYRRNNL